MSQPRSRILTRSTLQFYAIEITRNRLGLNDAAHEEAKANAEKEAKEKEVKATKAGKKTEKS